MVSYRFLKIINVLTNIYDVPLGVYSGVMLATDKIYLAGVSLTILIISACFSTWMYWHTMERFEKELFLQSDDEKEKKQEPVGLIRS